MTADADFDADPASIDLNAHIRDIPDFPQPGILFKDITPLLAHPLAFRASVDRLAEAFAGRSIDIVAAAEARGFLFGTPLALRLGVGFVPIRKPGKLPYSTVGMEYVLEYGSNRLEMHSDAIQPGQRVLLVDDVLATGGTMAACRTLVERAGGIVVASAFVIELGFLNGRAVLEPGEVFALLKY
jgi:adenine phosphoribosyltransferase